MSRGEWGEFARFLFFIDAGAALCVWLVLKLI